MTTGDQTDIPAGYEPLPLADAARRLGVSPNAVLQRRKRGTIHARQIAPRQWLYYVPPVGAPEPEPTTRRSQATRREPTDRNVLAPILADLIRQNGDLHAANAVLSERNRMLADRLAAFESGMVAIPLAATTATETAGRTQTHADAPEPHAMMPDTIATIPARPEPSNRIRRAWNVLRGRE